MWSAFQFRPVFRVRVKTRNFRAKLYLCAYINFWYSKICKFLVLSNIHLRCVGVKKTEAQSSASITFFSWELL